MDLNPALAPCDRLQAFARASPPMGATSTPATMANEASAGKNNSGRSEKGQDLAENLNPAAETGSRPGFKSISSFGSWISDLNRAAETVSKAGFKSLAWI